LIAGHLDDLGQENLTGENLASWWQRRLEDNLIVGGPWVNDGAVGQNSSHLVQ